VTWSRPRSRLRCAGAFPARPLLAPLLLGWFLLAGPAQEPARALEPPSFRWDAWSRRPVASVREHPDTYWWIPVDSGAPGRLETGAARNAGLVWGWLPVQTLVSVHDAAGSAGQRKVLVPEEDGVAVRDHLWAGASSGVGASFRESWTGAVQLLAAAQDGGPWRGRLEQLRVTRSGARHRFTVGRSAIRWGAGIQGSLLLGRSARPRWQLRWGTVRPLRIPFTGGRGGSWQPSDWLELTGTRTVLFGGKDRTDRLNLGGLWNILIARNENLRGPRPPSDSDQRASFEARLHLPWLTRFWTDLEGLEIFWEYGGEDLGDQGLPTAVAHHYGAIAVVRGWTGMIEYADTVTGRNRWYSHTVYGHAYYYQGLPLGLPQDGDSWSLWSGVWSPEAPLRLRLSRTEQLFGIFSGARERRVGWELAVRGRLTPRLLAEGSLARTRRVGPGRENSAPGFLEDQFLLRLTAR
jgi:hypothetical protein